MFELSVDPSTDYLWGLDPGHSPDDFFWTQVGSPSTAVMAGMDAEVELPPLPAKVYKPQSKGNVGPGKLYLREQGGIRAGPQGIRAQESGA